jgi:hypothetical protein
MRYRADDLAGANGSAVSSWAESSGNGLPALAQATGTAQPTVVTNAINGHKAVAFDGTSDFMTMSGSALAVAQNKASLGIWVVYSYPSAVGGAGRTLFGLSTGTSATSTRCLVQQKDASGLIATGGRRLDANTGVFITGGTSVAGSTEVISAMYDWTNADLLLFKNGAQTASNLTFQTAGSSENTVSLAGVVGANLPGTAEFAAVSIAEIVVYSAVDAATRAAVSTYIQATYGVTQADASLAGDLWHIQGDIIP